MEKSILVSIIAVFAVLTLMTFVNASTGSLSTSWAVSVNGAEAQPFGIEAGETVPIKVVFRATENASDVVVKASIDGFRSEISDKTERFQLVEGSVYTKYLSLELPSDIDSAEEDLTLRIRIFDRTNSDENEYTINLQRESYKLVTLSATVPDQATAGSVIATDVVLKNLGAHKLEDVFVTVRIPDLGISTKSYFGDIDPFDEDEVASDLREADRHDSAEKRIYLTIPENAKAGVYTVEVEASNVDSSTLVKKSIVISGTGKSSSVLSGSTSQTVSIGQETTYDLILVNSGSKVQVYTLTPETAEGLTVVVPPVVTVQAGSSQTVKVSVTPTSSATEGTHVVTVDAQSDGQTVGSASFTANVQKATKTVTSNSVIVLTIVLVIVFVVLLIILIVLLTRKPATVETEETSYY